MTGIFSELRRRNVFRVAIAYAVVAWLVAQIADIALESFSAPEWVMQTLLLLLIIGLPVAITLAWAFELTPDGVFAEPLTMHLNWRTDFSHPMFADIVVDPRVQEGMQRWEAEEEVLREEIRDYLASRN